MENICRNCGYKSEVGEGIFIEQDQCHCESCHDVLFTKEEWDALYKEWNMDDDGTEGCGTCFYWTEVQEEEADGELFL